MFNLFRRKKNKNHTIIKLDKNNLPKHIAIIMDGNGRWAKARNLPRILGHRAGVETIREIVKECNNIGIKYLTLYAFSTENWKRPPEEINNLMKLLVEYLRNEFDELNENNVVINSIGDIKGLPEVCIKELKDAYNKSKNNTGLVLNLALNYGGRKELVEAIKHIVLDSKNGKISEIDESLIEKYLYTKGMPDPDLVIRPSGEQRISNFLLWQSAYSEFWYSNINWPDFRKENLRRAISDYQRRNRRFGGVKQEEIK